MKRDTVRDWRPWRSGPRTATLFGGFGLVVVVVFVLASVGSALAMGAVAVLLGAVIATVVWWSGQPLPEPPPSRTQAGSGNVTNELPPAPVGERRGEA